MKLKSFSFKKIINSLGEALLPNKRDNVGQIILKIVFPFSLAILISFFVFISIYFSKINHQQAILIENRQVFSQFPADKNGHYQKGLNYFKKQNSDLKGWISIKNTDLSSPIYQSKDNNYYLSHNQLKERSNLGTLFFDYKDDFSSKSKDQNFIIYGKNENSLFACIQNYKSMYYYMENPIIEFSTLEATDKYAIFSVFIINSYKKDDGDYIFNYKKSSFKNSSDFSNWYNESMERSLYSTDVSVSGKDNFITLVTESDEFKGAKLVVIAKKLKNNELVNTANTIVNKNPLYPDIYYKQKQIDNPFTDEEENYVS